MRVVRKTAAISALVTLTLAGAAPRIVAQSPSDAATAGARALFEEGIVAMEAGQREQAVDRFREANALRPAPVIEYNLANALGRLGRYLEAAQLFERVRDAIQAPDNVRAQSREALEQLDSRLAVVVVRVEGPAQGTVVRVDQREHAAGTAVRLAPGEHAVALLRGADVLDERRVELPPGRTEVTLRAPTLASVALVSSHDEGPAFADAAALGRPLASTGDAELPMWPLVVGGAGLAIGLVGLAEYLYVDSSLAAYEDHCAHGRSDVGCAGYRAENDPQLDTAMGLRQVATGAMVLGGALVATGGVLWLVRPADADDSAAVGCGATWTGVACRGRF